MRIRPYPTPPDDVKNYLFSNPETKKEMNSYPEKHTAFWNNPVVKEYFNQCDRIKDINQRNKNWNKWANEIINTQEFPVWTD